VTKRRRVVSRKPAPLGLGETARRRKSPVVMADPAWVDPETRSQSRWYWPEARGTPLAGRCWRRASGFVDRQEAAPLAFGIGFSRFWLKVFTVSRARLTNIGATAS
jgi:hypothetical protein